MSVPLEVFCCYAREDQAMLEHLKKHLMPLQRSGQITIWSDTNLNAGVEWEKELHRHLESANIILLLISPDFIASDYCYSTEMDRALARHNEGNAQVIPILLRSILWQTAPFAKLQITPTNAKPVTSWPDRDDAFHDIALQIDQAVSALQIKRAPINVDEYDGKQLQHRVEEEKQIERIAKEANEINELLRNSEIQIRIRQSIQKGRNEVQVPISSAARLFSFSESQLREWEKRGLLSPTRISREYRTGQRRYSLDELDKLAIIRELVDGKFRLSEFPLNVLELWNEIVAGHVDSYSSDHVLRLMQDFLLNNENQNKIRQSMQKSRNEAYVSIGEAAQLFGLTESRLREWEKRGFITSIRHNRAESGSVGQRRYSLPELDKIAIVSELITTGVPLREIPMNIDTLWKSMQTSVPTK